MNIKIQCSFCSKVLTPELFQFITQINGYGIKNVDQYCDKLGEKCNYKLENFQIRKVQLDIIKVILFTN